MSGEFFDELYKYRQTFVGYFFAQSQCRGKENTLGGAAKISSNPPTSPIPLLV